MNDPGPTNHFTIALRFALTNTREIVIYFITFRNFGPEERIQSPLALWERVRVRAGDATPVFH